MPAARGRASRYVCLTRRPRSRAVSRCANRRTEACSSGWH
jgi:hypothetical protein